SRRWKGAPPALDPPPRTRPWLAGSFRPASFPSPLFGSPGRERLQQSSSVVSASVHHCKRPASSSKLQNLHNNRRLHKSFRPAATPVIDDRRSRPRAFHLCCPGSNL